MIWRKALKLSSYSRFNIKYFLAQLCVQPSVVLRPNTLSCCCCSARPQILKTDSNKDDIVMQERNVTGTTSVEEGIEIHRTVLSCFLSSMLVLRLRDMGLSSRECSKEERVSELKETVDGVESEYDFADDGPAVPKVCSASFTASAIVSDTRRRRFRLLKGVISMSSGFFRLVVRLSCCLSDDSTSLVALMGSAVAKAELMSGSAVFFIGLRYFSIAL